MKYSRIILGGLVAFTTTAHAMPTPEQTKKVEPLVMDLMRDDQAALKSGKKTRVEVAESAMELAEKAESEAAKLLLMKGAFNLYVRAGEFDKAIETLQSLQTTIPDIPPANVANIIEASLRVVSRKNGGQLYRLLDETKTRMRYTNEAASLEKSVKRNPADRTLRLKLAEHYAYLGKWDLALENFAAADGKVGAIAKSERGGEAATEKIADFWWTYPTGKAEELVKCFRTHAAKLYESAIASGAITGLNKVQAERRIEEILSNTDITNAQFHNTNTGKTIVINLGKGERLEFVRCPAGSFEREPGDKITISRPFYMTKYPLTLGQWCALTDGSIEKFAGKYSMGLGGKNCAFPGASYMRAMNLAQILTKKYSSFIPKSGYVFRLPSVAEYDLALRDCKGAVEKYYTELNHLSGNDYVPGQNDREEFLKKAGIKYDEKDVADWIRKTGMKVGTKKPNRLGLYDMLGNGDPIMMDTFEPGTKTEERTHECIDPFLYSESQSAHNVVWWQFGCKTGWSFPCNKLVGQERQTMRLVIGPDLVRDYKRKSAKSATATNPKARTLPNATNSKK